MPSCYTGYGEHNKVLNELDALKGTAQLRANDLRADVQTAAQAQARADVYGFVQLKLVYGQHEGMVRTQETLEALARERACNPETDGLTRAKAQASAEAYAYVRQMPAFASVFEQPKRSGATQSHTPRERSWSTPLFAVCERPVPGEGDEAPSIEGYLVAHPESGELCSNRSFPDGYCYMPLLMDKAQAQALAQRLAAPSGCRWEAVAAPAPCAHCGRVIWADDRDFCYPLNREATKWRAGCNEHDFGCGHEVFGDSKEAALQAWTERGKRKDPAPIDVLPS